MDEEDLAGDDVPPENDSPASGAFAAGALALRMLAQQRYGARLLEKLNQIAMDDKSVAVQVSAIRAMFDQVLGRPMSGITAAPQQDEDMFAGVATRSAELKQKLDRIAQLDAETAAPERAERV
jgi:hypothetical protein